MRLVDYGEADRIVTFLTPGAGKLSALARGARRSRRRYGGLALFAGGEAELGEGRGELWHLESFAVATVHPGLAEDVARLAHASYGVELARELTPAGQPEPGVYEAVLELLELLGHAAAEPSALRAFELRVLDAVGLGPVLDRCAGCGSAELDQPRQGFDAGRGGAVCPACRGPRAGDLGAAARAALLELRGRPLAWAQARPLGPEVAAPCREALVGAVLAHLGKPLRSLDFILRAGHRQG